MSLICAGSGLEPSAYLPRLQGGRCPACRQVVPTRNGLLTTHARSYRVLVVDAERRVSRLLHREWADRDPDWKER